MRISKDLVAVLILSVVLSILSVMSILTIREVSQNQINQKRFAAYMKCLIVPDEARYEELGKDAYVEYCTTLLRAS